MSQSYQYVLVQQSIGLSWEGVRKLWEKFISSLKQEKAVFTKNSYY